MSLAEVEEPLEGAIRRRLPAGPARIHHRDSSPEEVDAHLPVPRLLRMKVRRQMILGVEPKRHARNAEDLDAPHGRPPVPTGHSSSTCELWPIRGTEGQGSPCVGRGESLSAPTC